MTQRACYACPAFAIASVLNPAYFAGCGSDADGPHFQHHACAFAATAYACGDRTDKPFMLGAYSLESLLQ
jgi:hypothetical protein